MEVSQKSCRRIRRGQERWESACSLLGLGWLPQAVAGWEPVVAAGTHQAGRRWKQGLLLIYSGEEQVPESCCCAVGEEEKRQGVVGCCGM